MGDRGLTHIALTVTDPDRSIAFYEKYAAMRVVHRRHDDHGGEAVWLSDLTRPFVIVLVKAPSVEMPLSPSAHLGVACGTRAEMDRLCAEARTEGVLFDGPHDWPPPVGHWAFLRDPDGHTLELSHGQDIEYAVAQARDESAG